MRLSRPTDFSLRILMLLAREGGKITNSELSKKLNIPPAQLVKLVRELAKRKYLRTLQGKGGGVVPLADPKRVNLLEIIELVEGPLVFSECLLDPQFCENDARCKLKKQIAKLQQENRRILKGATIADIA